MDKVSKTIWVSFFVNIVLILLKLITSIVTKTHIIMADAIHSFSDLITDVASFIGHKLSLKKNNKKFPKGEGKIEYITSLIIGVAIIIFSVSLAKEAILSPISVISNKILLIVLISIAVKYFVARYLYVNGKKYNNNILIASGIESRADVLSSISVLIALIAYNFKDIVPILKYSDMVGTLVISLFILKTGFSIIRENLALIIGRSEEDEDIIERAKEVVRNTEGVLRLNELVLIKNGSYYDSVISISIGEKLNIKQAHEIEKKIKSKLKQSSLNIKYVSLSICPHKD